MNLKVKLLDQSVHELDVDLSTLISDLKAVLEATLNIPIDRQRLIYRGRMLRDENTLEELGIEAGHTIHLVERPADAQDARPQPASQSGGMDLNRLLQGVFSALGGASPAAGGQPQQQPLAPPHLLQSITEYLQQLSSPASSGSFPVMPVTSLAPGLPPASTAGGQLQQSLAAALQHILSGQNLTQEQRTHLQQAAAGAPNMQVVLAALAVLLSRAQAYVTGPFAATLSTAVQQLQQASQAQAQSAGVNDLLTATSGQLQAAAALLVELARVVSAASLASQGNAIALTQNMAAVLREGSRGGLEPSFPTLYPQTTLGASGAPRSAPAATAAAGSAPPQQQQQPSGQQIAEMVASALSSSLAPVIQQVSAEVENAVRAGRSQVASGQFEAATTAARAAATNHVSTTVSRVLNIVTDAINTNVCNIEQRLQQVEQQAGRDATAVDIASAVQQVLLPNLNLQPIGSVIGAAARAAASSTAAAAAAARAAQAAQEAAAAAGAQAAETAAASTSGAPAPSAPPAAAAAATEGPSSSRQQPQGLGLGLKSGALPAKRKATGVPPAASGGASSSAAAAASQAGGSVDGSASSVAARSAGVSGSGAAHGPLARKATLGTSRPSEIGRAGSHGGSPHVNPVTETAEDMDGVEQQQQQPPPDMAALMQMMGGMFGGAAGGAPASAATASMGQRPTSAAAVAPRSAGALGAAAGAGGAGDLSGLMQMVGGMFGGSGGGAGGAGGMGGLLQMAGQIASDPAMQPLMNNIASSLLGGGGAGGAAGGAGSLGDLLSGLLGGAPPGSMNAVGTRNRGSATVVVGMDDLEHELPAEAAAQWRRVLEEDARAQTRMLAQGRGSLSEVYLAGAPVKQQSLANLIPGSN